jgi:hypothetical protein
MSEPFMRPLFCPAKRGLAEAGKPIASIRVSLGMYPAVASVFAGAPKKEGHRFGCPVAPQLGEGAAQFAS